MTFIRFLHLVGIAAWLGSGAATALIVRAAAGDPAARRAERLELVGRLYAWLVAPGAILATASGVAITMMAASAGFGARLGAPASIAMQLLGLTAGFLEVFLTFPASQRLLRAVLAAPEAELAGAGERMRRRVAALGPVALALVVISLYLGVIATPHG
ncbi:MAG TPA: DUF2269 family protein [Gemmatimonadales bacterium]|nr:DUF2269 family protein [Gemmatimonadales bacterium]